MLSNTMSKTATVPCRSATQQRSTSYICIKSSYKKAPKKQIQTVTFASHGSDRQIRVAAVDQLKNTIPGQMQEVLLQMEQCGGDSEYAMFTLTTWLIRMSANNLIDDELNTVINAIATACKQISSLVKRAQLQNLTGLAGGENVQGEEQKKLDVISNEIFASCLRCSGRTSVLASEEVEIPVAVEETYSGEYVVVFDPLDGSSNIDAGISVGSIFGVYETIEKCVTNVQQPGDTLKAAGYCLYSSATVLVLSVGQGVYGFTLDEMSHEFVLSHRNIRIPEVGKIYSFNEGNYNRWDPSVQQYIDSLKNEELWGGSPYSARYIGSMVGDFHRTLLYGGIYGYPSDRKNKQGKLRLLYECAPMSYLAEQANGKASTGQERVLDIVPAAVHQRTPIFIGSKREVEYLETFTKTNH
eukprot:TRINITY_DN3358_c0_g1_i9.p1 TRINITY_DN3358_c0_g1~~TRINITY_DN3358_c0_g1_i9.p1  ORF type:complete len:472 (-),score=53.53 TRINITY_DN3358_c0_g1_i9:1938-3173(-)